MDGLFGGQLYTAPDAPLDPDIRDFVDDLTSIPIGVFPDVYVNFRRTGEGSPFRWGDEASTELPSTDGRWVPGSPVVNEGMVPLDCGCLVQISSSIGFTNADCLSYRGVLCTVNSVPCPMQGDACNPNPCTSGQFQVIQCNSFSGDCECPDGYILTTVTGPCADINECLNTNTNNCDLSTTTCSDNIGSFTCPCRNGFQNVGLLNVCSNIDECTVGSDNCDPTTTICQDNFGGFTCECLGSRVQQTSTSCIDECAANVDGCDEATTTCVPDADGAAVCSCIAGFVLIPGSTTACQQSSSEVCCPAFIDNNIKYILLTAGRCVYFNISAFGTFNSFDTTLCASLVKNIGQTGGRLLELSGVQSLDSRELKELVVRQSVIPISFPQAVYVDLRRATSTSAFQWGDTSQTTLPSNDDLWVADSPQAATGNCGAITNRDDNILGYTNVDCSFFRRAFCSLDPIECAQDIDECAENTDNCSPQATCTNTFGSFTCTCDQGFIGSGVSCSDECAENTDNCSPQATCTNTFGSFTCICDQGFIGSGVSCSDIDECAENTDNCSPQATCTNIFGSFTCTCDQGFIGNGVSCSDIDECATSTDNCSPDATCTDNFGSFTCSCNQGFIGDGITCSADIDECARNTDNCSPEATCINTMGSYTCNCLSGFDGDGVTCRDINECAMNTDNCSSEAKCENSDGGFSCFCFDGFAGDGMICSDIDECALNTDNCSPEATCTNTIGRYTCACLSGFDGDGVTCRASDGGVIIGIITACSVIVAIIFLFLVCIGILLKRNSDLKRDASPRRTSLKDTEGQSNEGYMELQETKRMKVNTEHREIPSENIILLSALPGRGHFEYHKAKLVRTSQTEDVVVKKLSADAPVRLATLQATEVEKISALPHNVNVVQLLGFCSTVPVVLIYEFLDGKQLSDYLVENFGPNKRLMYNNVKQNLYPVPEEGFTETLTIFALHIARGMAFLTARKFIHPGLRAKKVIIDVKGQCKLYGFVSEENAEELSASLWKEHVPYQWMPPEYLFLEQLHASGDIWSFGVLLWEIYSYGAQPHSGKDRHTVEQEIKEKRHLPIPNNCPGAIWQLALNCWVQRPERRPSFEETSVQLSRICSDNKEYEQI